MQHEDIDFSLDLTAEEKWNTTRFDFEGLIGYKLPASFIAEMDGTRIGLVSAVSYGKIGFIGHLIVKPDFRERGIGTKLMKYGIERLEACGVNTLFLDAVQEAVPLYEKFSFEKVSRSLRFLGNVKGKSVQPVRPMTREDLERVFEIDRKVFGGDRSHFLERLHRKYPDLCLVSGNESISGYIMGSDRQQAVRLGPLISTKGAGQVRALLLSFVARSNGLPIGAGILEKNSQSVKVFESVGFQYKTFSWRMRRGMPAGTRRPNMEYAIGSPAIG